VITARGGSARVLARVLRMSVPAVEQRLQRLLKLGLITRVNADTLAYIPGHGVQPSGAREVHYVAESPAATLGALLKSQTVELIDAGAAVEHLSMLYAGSWAAPSGACGQITVVEGSAEVNQAVFELLSDCQLEILNLDRQPFVRAERPCALQPAMFEVLRRGVKVRTIYAGDAFRVAGYNEYMTEAAALGECARLLTHLPIRLIIVDGRVALLPLASNGPWISTALLAYGNELVEDLTHVFEDLWGHATPMHGCDVDRAEFTEPEIVLLRMLSTDMTEAAIGRHLGASSRTVGRRLAELQHKLGAQTRFGMGAEAARRGLL
jgi:DNA-binding CsgD family transcriptional regulator/DNA-binding Lrp family transcriptional regulator